MIKACPHFGPSPARDQWIAGWEAARRANPAPVAQPLTKPHIEHEYLIQCKAADVEPRLATFDAFIAGVRFAEGVKGTAPAPVEQPWVKVVREFIDAYDAQSDPTAVGSTCRYIRAEEALRALLPDSPVAGAVSYADWQTSQVSARNAEIHSAWLVKIEARDQE